jgi:hypothetical protein
LREATLTGVVMADPSWCQGIQWSLAPASMAVMIWLVMRSEISVRG